MIRISTVIPVYNGEATIARTIDTAISQDFSGAEIIVVNDGSTDFTRRILETYGSRIQVLNQANRGAASARNAGAAAARGEYLAFLDADDLWKFDKLTKTLAALERNKNAALAFSDFTRVLGSGEEFDEYVFGRAPSMQELLTSRSAILPSTVLMRSSVFERCGGFCEQFCRNYFEDPYMWTIAREQGEFEYIPEALVTYRMSSRVAVDRYVANGLLFAQLISERYGKKASVLIGETRDHLARFAMQDALRRMDGGDSSGAFKSWILAVRVRPAVIFERDIMARFLRVRNIRRVVRMARSWTVK